MSGTTDERKTFSGTSQTVEPRKPFDPDTDQVSAIRSLFPWFNRDYLDWVEEGRQRHADRQQAEVNRIADLAKADADRIADLFEYRDKLGTQIRMKINTFLRTAAAQAGGGGGKSSLIAAVANTLALCGKKNPLVIDNNQAMGQIQVFLGIEEVNMTTRLASDLARRGELEDSAAYVNKLPINEYGVLLLASDEVVDQYDLYQEDVAADNMRLSQRHLGIALNDMGNAINDSASAGVYDMLNALMLPSGFDSIRIDQARKTRETLYGWRDKKEGFGPLVENAITVATGLKTGRVLEEFRHKLELPGDRLLFAQPFVAQLAVEDLPSINFEKLPVYYEIASREIALMNLIVARRHEQGQPLTAADRQHYKTGHLVELESGMPPGLPWIDGSEPIAIEQKGA